MFANSVRPILGEGPLSIAGEEIPLESIESDLSASAGGGERASHVAVKWGVLAAAAKRHVEDLRVQYRVWRDSTMLRLLDTEKDDKGKSLAQWKLELKLRALDEYQARNTEINHAEMVWGLAASVYSVLANRGGAK